MNAPLSMVDAASLTRIRIDAAERVLIALAIHPESRRTLGLVYKIPKSTLGVVLPRLLQDKSVMRIEGSTLPEMYVERWYALSDAGRRRVETLVMSARTAIGMDSGGDVDAARVAERAAAKAWDARADPREVWPDIPAYLRSTGLMTQSMRRAFSRRTCCARALAIHAAWQAAIADDPGLFALYAIVAARWGAEERALVAMRTGTAVPQWELKRLRRGRLVAGRELTPLGEVLVDELIARLPPGESLVRIREDMAQKAGTGTPAYRVMNPRDRCVLGAKFRRRRPRPGAQPGPLDVVDEQRKVEPPAVAVLPSRQARPWPR